MLKKLIGICFLAFLSFSVFAQTNTMEEAEKEYQKRLKKEVLEGVYIPKDLSDCFSELNRVMDPKGKIIFQSMSEQDAVSKLYFSLGRWIRYNWSLWRGSRLSAYMNEMGFRHPEYQSVVIIVAYHRYLNKKDIQLKVLATDAQEAWEKDMEAKKKKMKEGYN